MNMKYILLLLPVIGALSFQSIADEERSLGNLVIIETELEDTVSHCLGFLLDDINVMTTSKCTVNPEKIKIYRSISDCNKRRNTLYVEPLNFPLSESEGPVTIALNESISEQPNAYVAFPSLAVEEDLNCYFLIKNNNQLEFFQRQVAFHKDHLKAKGGVFRVITKKPTSFPGIPIPGAVLFNQYQAIIGMSFKNGQLYSPMAGFLINFHTVALQNKYEL